MLNSTNRKSRGNRTFSPNNYQTLQPVIYGITSIRKRVRLECSSGISVYYINSTTSQLQRLIAHHSISSVRVMLCSISKGQLHIVLLHCHASGMMQPSCSKSAVASLWLGSANQRSSDLIHYRLLWIAMHGIESNAWTGTTDMS